MYSGLNEKKLMTFPESLAFPHPYLLSFGVAQVGLVPQSSRARSPITVSILGLACYEGPLSLAQLALRGAWHALLPTGSRCFRRLLGQGLPLAPRPLGRAGAVARDAALGSGLGGAGRRGLGGGWSCSRRHWLTVRLSWGLLEKQVREKEKTSKTVCVCLDY